MKALMFKFSRVTAAVAALSLIVALGFAPTVPAYAQTTPVAVQSVENISASIIVPVNKSQILKVDRPFADLLVGNPAIADVLPLTNQTVYVLGKALGSTNLAIYAKNKQLIAVIDINISYDIEALKAQLFELMPNETIEVHASNGAIILGGTVSSSERAAKALSIAERYAPDNVTNLLSVKGSQQVMLAVKFAEVSRTVVREFGLNTTGVFSLGNDDFTLSTGGLVAGSAAAAALPGFLSAQAAVGDFLFDLQALEEKGLVKTLAEPNLIALSGDTANFLAGGEFPIPVLQESSTGFSTGVTIEFKEFGVSLAFTPTVLGNGLINLNVAPEVSSLEPSVTNIAGINVPALSTRRAKTTVELKDGQSFAIAGLIQSDFTDTVEQVPGLGNVPIIGALARSSGFRREETELVIIVTPYLVKSASPDLLASPTDSFVPPSDMDIFFWGRNEAQISGTLHKTAGEVKSADAGGGIDGPYGYIVK